MKTHGMSKTRIYGIWAAMRRRCEDAQSPAFKDYGARGIYVCDEWQTFEKFFADMGEPPHRFTIERRDNDGPYCKKNCDWVSYTEQGRNKRNNVLITARGQTLPISAWAEITGIKAGTLYYRVELGWVGEEVLETKTRHNRKGVPRGTKIYGFRPTDEIAQRLTNIDDVKERQRIYNRIKRGWDIERAFSTVGRPYKQTKEGARRGIVFREPRLERAA